MESAQLMKFVASLSAVYQFNQTVSNFNLQ